MITDNKKIYSINMRVTKAQKDYINTQRKRKGYTSISSYMLDLAFDERFETDEKRHKSAKVKAYIGSIESVRQLERLIRKNYDEDTNVELYRALDKVLEGGIGLWGIL